MKKIKNPLIRRIPKDLIGDWKKYLVVFLFLVLTIGFVSGMYVANESMITSANEGVTKYKQEDGHFELKKQADATLLSAIETGEKADVKQYYLEQKRNWIKNCRKNLRKNLTKSFRINLRKNSIKNFRNSLRNLLTKNLKSSLSNRFRQNLRHLLRRSLIRNLNRVSMQHLSNSLMHSLQRR